MKYQGVLFDLDGTLLDTLKDLANSVNVALERLGFPTHGEESYKNFVGDGRDILAARALPENHRDSTTVTQLVEFINEEYTEQWANNTAPYQGIPDLLDELTAGNMKMAILSNKDQHFTELIVSRILSRWSFEAVVGLSPEVIKKPDPTAAIQLAQQLGISAAEFLYMGDTGTDMKTAVGAGMYPVGVLWGFRSAEELLAGGAKKLIEHPREFLELLK
ncbi:HAD family hydrolase [Chloroflexota bacterium]